VFDGADARWTLAVTDAATGATRRFQHTTLQALPSRLLKATIERTG
jgi:hypothetical protein